MRAGGESGDNGAKVPFGERIRGAFLKPGAADAPPPGMAAGTPDTVPELEALVKQANDQERLVGVLGAPIAAAIATFYTFHSINQDPAKYLASGAANSKYVSLSLYHELLIVMLGLSLLMMVTALLRKRLALGMSMALYGLAMFNLHGYGFAIPYLMVGSWLLVRAYRLQRSLREAAGTGPRASTYGRNPSGVSRPSSNKRYTPPSARSRRTSRRTNEV